MDNNPPWKKVVLLLGRLTGGGAERVASLLERHLSEKLSVRVVILDEATENDYPTKRPPVSLGGKRRNPVLRMFQHVSLLKRYVQQNDITHVVSFMEYPNLLNILARNKQTCRIVSVRSFMSEKWNRKKGAFWRASFRLLYPRADALVAPTCLIETDMAQNFLVPRRICHVIYNPYDIAEIKEAAEDAIAPEFAEWFGPLTVVTVGRMEYPKGYDGLLRAFSLVVASVPEARLVLIGDGMLREKLKGLSVALGVERSVLFMGFQKNPHKYTARSAVYVLSSRYEGFPNMLVEAMVCKTAVIASDCRSGPREILAPDTAPETQSEGLSFTSFGVLAPVMRKECYSAETPFSAEESAWASGIEYLLKNAERREALAANGRERALDFSIEKIIFEWEKLL